MIGKMVAEKLGIAYYDKEIIAKPARLMLPQSGTQSIQAKHSQFFKVQIFVPANIIINIYIIPYFMLSVILFLLLIPIVKALTLPAVVIFIIRVYKKKITVLEG